MISWEYLAGMVDADGSIGSTRTGKEKNIVGRVIVTNTNHEFLSLLKEQFGGSLSLRKKGHKHNWKPFGSLTWTNRQALYILQNIQPFLLIKKTQASICIELIKMKDAPKSERCDYHIRCDKNGRNRAVARLKPKIIMQEQKLSAMMNDLNKKGVN